MPSNCGVRGPWTASGSNQSVLKEINPEYSLKGVMLKLKLQIFGHLMRRADSLKRPWRWERLKAEGEGDDRMRGWMASPIQWTWVWASSGRWWRTGSLICCSLWGQVELAATEQEWVTAFSLQVLFPPWRSRGDWMFQSLRLALLSPHLSVESERCLISVTKVTFISFITENPKGFRSSC